MTVIVDSSSGDGLRRIMPESDRRIIDFIKWLRGEDYNVARRLFESFYYHYGPINDLMEEGWKGAVQHDYPEEFDDEDN